MSLFWKRTEKKAKSRGYSSSARLSFNHDGLEIARTRRKKSRWLPVWHIIFFVYICLLVRLIAMAEAGPATYANRMENMRNGSFLERTAARIMHMDPVSRALAVKVRRGLKELSSG